MPSRVWSPRHFHQRLEDDWKYGLRSSDQGVGDAIAGRACQLFIGEQNYARLEDIFTGSQFCNRIALPAENRIPGQDEIGVGGSRQPAGTFFDFTGKGFSWQRRSAAFASGLSPVDVRLESESVELTNMMAFDFNIAIRP